MIPKNKVELFQNCASLRLRKVLDGFGAIDDISPLDQADNNPSGFKSIIIFFYGLVEKLNSNSQILFLLKPSKGKYQPVAVRCSGRIVNH